MTDKKSSLAAVDTCHFWLMYNKILCVYSDPDSFTTLKNGKPNNH